MVFAVLVISTPYNPEKPHQTAHETIFVPCGARTFYIVFLTHREQIEFSMGKHVSFSWVWVSRAASQI